MDFTTNKYEMTTISAIARLAHALARDIEVDYPTIDCIMDLSACHSNGCPLRLKDLLAAATTDPGSFGHDVLGIRRFMDRTTGMLRDSFRPRFASRCAAEVR